MKRLIVSVEFSGSGTDIRKVFELVVKLADSLGLEIFDLRIRPDCRRL